jgi:hypothetical protein
MTEFEHWMDSVLRDNQRKTFGPDQATLRTWLMEAYRYGRREARPSPPVDYADTLQPRNQLYPWPREREEGAA